MHQVSKDNDLQAALRRPRAEAGSDGRQRIKDRADHDAASNEPSHEAPGYDCPSEYRAMFRWGAQFIAIVESAIEIRSMALGHQAFGGVLRCCHAHRLIMFALAALGERHVQAVSATASRFLHVFLSEFSYGWVIDSGSDVPPPVVTPGKCTALGLTCTSVRGSKEKTRGPRSR